MSEFSGTTRGRVIRGDIEGLRALAVMSVLVNHAFPNGLRGGFVGVDVFFVISGYLIGRHLLQDIQAGRFSILGFYAKRARRIFPALALVLIAVWGVGWLVLSAPEYSALGQHIVASAFFSNNILLWSESGYFDAASLDKPLLHLWSLGIEEQFYLLVPAMLWFGSKGSSGSIRWVARLGALSLFATVVLGNFSYAASFYLLHTRFWELAVGVVLAQAELRMHARSLLPPDVRYAFAANAREVLVFAATTVFLGMIVLGSSEQRWDWDVVFRDGGLVLLSTIAVFAAFCLSQTSLPREILSNGARLANASSAVGITMICASAVALTSTEWPGAQTLFPVVGTAMVIAATPITALNKMLAVRPLTFIGEISYPLYLWHWPLIVFYRLLNPRAHAIEMALPLAVSFALAWLTKTLLEDPVRFGKLGLLSFQRPNMGSVVVGLVIASALGSIAVATDGLPSRIPPELQAIATWSESSPYADWRPGRCYELPNAVFEFANECTPAKRPGVPLVLLWGDSHAAHLYPGLATVESKHSFDIAQWTAAGCPPTATRVIEESATCSERRATAFKTLQHLNPDVVLLAGAWELYMEKGESEADIIQSVAETIRQLKVDGDKEIVVFGPGPTWNTSLSSDLFRFMAVRRLKEIPERYGQPSGPAWHLDTAMADLAHALGVHYISVLSYFCDKSGCRTVGDRTIPRPDLLFFDSNHLTVSGSQDLITHSDLHLF